MKNNFAAAIVATLLLTTNLLAQQQAGTETLPAKPVHIDKEQAFVGKRVYQVVNAGEPAGLITVHSSFNDAGQYIIHDHSSSEFLGVDENILLVLDGELFTPIELMVSGNFSGQYLSINWKTENSAATGVVNIYQLEDGAHRRSEVSRELPAGTLSRGSVLFLANAMPIDEQAIIDLNWFNSMNGHVVPITLEVLDTQTVQVPAGTFETYRVEQRGGTPGNTLYITTEKPRRIVRFDVTDTEMTLDLMPE